MLFVIFATQILSNSERIIYYEVPSKFIPYISNSKAYLVSEDYKIKRGDILTIVFFGTYNQVYMQQVTHTGEIWIITTPTSLKFSNIPISEISGPNLGFFKVSGKKIKEVEKEINEIIKKKFEGTEIRVFVTETAPIEVHVVGNLEKPGIYYTDGLKRLSEFLKEALSKNVEKVILKRENQIDTIQIEQYFKNGDLTQNPFLLDGDVIIIPWNSK
ncbi:MAG: hypothetical protein ABDH37_00205 [Candidatus Hydrothermales bacterium]